MVRNSFFHHLKGVEFSDRTRSILAIWTVRSARFFCHHSRRNLFFVDEQQISLGRNEERAQRAIFFSSFRKKSVFRRPTADCFGSKRDARPARDFFCYHFRKNPFFVDEQVISLGRNETRARFSFQHIWGSHFFVDEQLVSLRRSGGCECAFV